MASSSPDWCDYLDDAGGRALPVGTLARLLDFEANTIEALPVSWWRALEWIVRSVVIDTTWLHDPAAFLAEGVDEADDLSDAVDAAALAAVCRSWSRVQALAVIDACLRSQTATLPTRPHC